MSLIITQKSDTLAALNAQNKIYGAGVIVISSDKTVFKIGDGVTPFTSLTNLFQGV
jgi:hypothetical protein